MNRQLAIFLLGGTALISLLSACASSGPNPEKSDPMEPIAGYLGLQEQVRGRDLSALQQRRIVLDPGHGGYFRGALGPNGLTEAEVNLGVALHLRGMLEWAGAQVWLTRTSDNDFLSPADSSLASDLAMRVSLSDSLQPHVFISIHHNSNAALDRTINETQTYYPLDDGGASLDLARSIHRHLVLNLGIEPASILPGNFHVLRNATVPAVLGEPAMISHPVMAERLSLAASQRLEAEAYFLGLLDYFSAGLPSWSGAVRDTLFFGAANSPTTVSWRFQPDGPPSETGLRQLDIASPGPDPTMTQLTLDGQPVTPRLSPNALEVTWTIPSDLAARPHLLSLQGRNLAGRATPPRRTLLLPAASSTPVVEILREADTKSWAVIWQGTDGGPVPKGVLKIGSTFSATIGPDLPQGGWGSASVPTQATFRSSSENESHTVALSVSELPAGQAMRLPLWQEKPYVGQGDWRGRLGSTNQTPFVVVTGQAPVWLESLGVQPLIDPDPTTPNHPRTVPHDQRDWPVTPLLPGLRGQTIVLDPAGGGSDTDGTGPLGLRGSDLNLLVAQHAAQLLRGAGATVYLTRNDEALVPAVEKVRFAGQVAADLFLTIGRHQMGQPRAAHHHPGSSLGQQWAEAARQASFSLPTPLGARADTCLVAASSAYLLRHTACPALSWTFDPPQTGASEILQLQPGWQRAEARAILLAIAAISGHPDIMSQVIDVPTVLETLAKQGGFSTDSVDWTMLDGNLMWSPLPKIKGAATTNLPVKLTTGPGLPARLNQHVIEIHAGDQWQLWLLTKNERHWLPVLMLASNDRLMPRATP